MTTKKAMNSIAYHKNETSKILLMTTMKINLKEIAPMKLSKNYLLCETLTTSLIRFFESASQATKNSQVYLDEEFFETSKLLLRVFKNSKVIYESLLKFFSILSFAKEQTKVLQRLKFQNFLCEKVWVKAGWKKFFLYCLRYVEKLI